jgi:1-acyl-sn-glycerol-3-phosphate acyltransferase
VDALADINTAEFLQAIGLAHLRRGRGMLEQLVRLAARQIAEDLARYDLLFQQRGLRRGAIAVLDALGHIGDVTGAEAIPVDGPLLVVANHRGFSDVLALFASLARDDLRVVAAEYPLLRALPGVNQRSIWVERGEGRRLSVLHDIIAHLRSRGAVLLFPAGAIEPHPALHDRAWSSLATWSTSIGLIARCLPHLSVVPAIISGVLVPRFQRHPLTWIRRCSADRQQLGAMLQVLARTSASATLRLSYGSPLSGDALFDAGPSARDITALVVEHARALLPQQPSNRSGGVLRMPALSSTLAFTG